MSPSQTAVAKPAATAKTGAARARRSPRRASAKAPDSAIERPVADQAGAPVAEATAHPVAAERAAKTIAKRDGVITELSDTWFEMARGGQTATLGALRKIVDAAVPLQGGEDSRRRKLIDSAFDLADRAGAAQLGLARGALQGSVLVYFDVDVTVDTDVDAFTGVDVDVTVPTNVKTLSI